MPVVSIPDCVLDPASRSERWSDVRVEARTNEAIVAELVARFPRIARLTYPPGWTERNEWFALWREANQDDLRATPNLPLGDDERVWLINQIGC